MFLFLFLGLVSSWSRQLLAVAFEIGMLNMSSDFRWRMLNAFRVSGDDFSHAAEGAQFLYSAASAPYNIPSFDHWHYDYYSLNPESLDVVEHSYTDNLYYNIDQAETHLFAADTTKPWPFSFNLKLYLCSACDVFSIFHPCEYFSSEFPDGDDHARRFFVSYNGRTMSLHDLWESGCGEFDDVDWNSVNDTRDEIVEKYPVNPFASYTNIYWSSMMKETRTLTSEYGYAQLKNNSVISQEYIDKCREITRNQVAKAGYALQVSLKRIAITVYQMPPMTIQTRKSEAIAWSLVAILLPVTISVMMKRFCGKK